VNDPGLAWLGTESASQALKTVQTDVDYILKPS